MITDHLPYADLVFDGGFGEGEMLEHPAGNMIVRAMMLTPTEMTVGLWEFGRHLVGQGLLKLADGRWSGVVTEYGGRWFVSARAGSSRLEFREHAEVAA